MREGLVFSRLIPYSWVQTWAAFTRSYLAQIDHWGHKRAPVSVGVTEVTWDGVMCRVVAAW